MKWLPGWAWTLIFRHLLARKSRPAVLWMNFFALIGLAIGVASWTSIVSIMNGLQGDIRQRILNEKPHFLWDGRPQTSIESVRENLQEVLGSNLKSVDFILQSEALLELTNTQQAGRIMGSGVVLHGIEGLGDQVLASAELLSSLGLSVEDPIRLHSVWKMELEPVTVTISGVFETGGDQVDRGYLRIDRKRLEKWLELPGAISRIEVRLNDPHQVLSFQEKMKFGEIQFMSWHQTESSLWYSLRLEKIIMTIAVFFIVLIASLAVHLALSVRVAEKTREIGLLRGLGADDNILSRLYLTEGVFLGFAGSALGLFLGWAFCSLFSKYWRLPNIFVSPEISVDWNWGTNVLLAFGAVFLAVLASWLPARKVATIEVQEALRS